MRQGTTVLILTDLEVPILLLAILVAGIGWCQEALGLYERILVLCLPINILMAITWLGLEVYG